jgi:hypothetical protein
VQVDLSVLCSTRLADLLAEAANERLAAQLPHRGSVVRHSLALACRRLARWLDANSNRYVQPSLSGPANWVPGPPNTYIRFADSVTPPAARDFKTRPTDQLFLR